jgi:hypothetical protein
LTSFLTSLCAVTPALAGREWKRDTHATWLNKRKTKKGNKEDKGGWKGRQIQNPRQSTAG